MAEFFPWPQLDSLIKDQITEFAEINSGIHIAMLATTRGGKTTLATGGSSTPGKGILGNFENVLVLDTTSDPGVIHDYGKPVQKYRGRIEGHRRLTVGDMKIETKRKVHGYMQKAIKQGNVAIYADEVRQLADRKFFGLGPMLDHIWLFGAKHGVSLIGGSQAPRWLPSSFYDQSKMHFIFGMRDRRAMKRLAEISGDVDELERTIPNLDRFHFAHVGIDGEVRTSVYNLTRNVRKTTGEKQLRVAAG